MLAAPASVMWDGNNPWCGDQGSVGACVAFAALSFATSKPSTLTFPTPDAFNAVALNAYHWVTANDSYPGTYPPTDTGSDTLTGCKWLVSMGYAKRCVVLAGKSAVLSALQTGPVMSGQNWFASEFSTDSCGRMTVSGVIEGGHDILIVGYDAATDEGVAQTNWGNAFGVKMPSGHGGYFRQKSSDTFGAQVDADFVQPVLQ
jgi:hypothetical protein